MNAENTTDGINSVMESYMAAKNAPNLSNQDRILLIMDAMERAKTAGVTIKWNNFMRSVVYGSDY